MHEIDSPDYNKARGFLIGFSLLVLLLWFFGIDIAKLRVMGTQLEFHRNGDYVWLVVSVVNAYLCLRFFQRLPEHALKPDEKMHQVIDECLISICRRLYKRDAARFAQKEMEEDEGASVKLLKVMMGGHISYRQEIERVQSDQYGAKHPWNYSYPERAELSYSLTKVYIRRGEQVTSHGGRRYMVTPHRVIYSLIFIYAFFKGLLGKPWFTDNVIPLVLGFLGVSVALSQWLHVWLS